MEEKRDKRLQQIGEKALMESVVSMVWQKTDEESGKRLVWLRGTGFFVSPNMVVTNIHCIAGAPSIFAELASTETRYPVEGVVAFDVENDLVILKVTGEGIPLSISDSDMVRSGDVTCSVGYPDGEKGVTTQVTLLGIRDSDKYVRIKGRIGPGHSGSALLNNTGEVIGVTVGASFEVAAFSRGEMPSISYAIPANVLNYLLVSSGEAEPLEEWQKLPRIRGYAQGVQGQMIIAEGKHMEAKKCFDIALELNPDLVEIYVTRAGLNVFLGEAEDAIADCDAAIERNPDFLEAYINRAAANLSLEQYKDVIADCDVAIKINSDLGWAYNNRAAAYLSLEQYKDAVADCDVAIKLDPDLVQSYICRAMAKFGLDQHEAALADFDIALKLNPDSIEVYFCLGNLKCELEDYAGAIENFDKMISINPEFSAFFNVYESRGEAKYRFGDYEGAIEDYDKVLQSNPKDDEAYNSRGLAKYHLGRSIANKGDDVEATKYFLQAIDDYMEAIKIDPEYAGYYKNIGLAKGKLGDYKGMIEAYDNAIQLRPEDEVSFYCRALAKCRLGRSKEDHGDIIEIHQYYQESIQDYTEAINIDPEYAAAYNGRGWTKYILGLSESEQGKKEDARILFQAAIVDSDEAIRLKPDKPSPNDYHTRAAAKAALGNYDEAIEDFSEAIRIKSDNALYYYERAQAKEAHGLHEGAKADFAKAKEIDPDVENKSF